MTACGDSVVSNEGPCVAQASVDPASQCDATKFSYYTCPGSRVPTLDAGSCTFSAVHGGFCCPLPTQAGNATQNGQIVDLLSPKTLVAGATIDFGNGISTTSDSSGNYTLQIKQNVPFAMTVSASNYTELQEQEWFLTGDYSAGVTHVVSAGLNAAVSSGLAGYDKTKAALGLGAEYNDGVNFNQGSCKDNAGATFTVTPASAGTLIYFGATHSPDASATSVQSGAVNPSALLYNLDPSAPLPTITVTPPAGCTVAKYPYTDGTITYTGNFKLLASGVDGQSFYRLFML